MTSFKHHYHENNHKDNLDKNSSLIAQSNVTKYNDGHRDEIIDYFSKKMNER